MYNAPSVTYPVGRSRALGWLLAFVWLLGLAALVSWAVLAEAWVWRQGAGLFCLALCGLAAACSWRQMAESELCWDGQDWHGGAPEGRSTASGRVTVHLDLQRHLLLCMRGAGRAKRWYWAEQSSQPQRWSDLRRAVYSRAKSVAVPTDTPQTATP